MILVPLDVKFGLRERPCGHGAYDLPGIPSYPRQCEERDAGAVQGGGEAARLKREIQGGFLEEVVKSQKKIMEIKVPSNTSSYWPWTGVVSEKIEEQPGP